MKRFLLAFLIAPLIHAEIVNLDCKYSFTFNVDENKSSPTSGGISISINTEDKTAKAKGGWIGYSEYGNEVRWMAVYGFDFGDDIVLADRYRLDRVSGELEQDFMYIRFPEGIGIEDTFTLRDEEKYNLGLVHSASCKKVKGIF